MNEAQRELKFCPRCAGSLTWQPAGDAALHHPVCDACGFVLWQNPKPAVEALILDDDGRGSRVLLGRQAGGADAGLWDVPGNFLNAGDEIEEALRRECRREMAVDVEVLGLIGAYAARFREMAIVDLVYRCRIASGEPSAADLIDEVRWFPLDDLPPVASAWLPRAVEDMRQQVG